MIIIEENNIQLYIADELKDIAKSLGTTYIDKGGNSNLNKGIIKVGNVVITVTYKDIITSIRTSINRNYINIDCTDGIDDLTTLCNDTQKASLIIKSIQEAGLMSINDIIR